MTFKILSLKNVKAQIQFQNFQKNEDIGLSKSDIQEEVEAAKLALRGEIDKVYPYS